MTASKRDPSFAMNEEHILSRERALRAWFTRNADPILAEIDGLDIGWGGVQRWATRRIPAKRHGPHLDFACGYGTFLAQLGFRFPGRRFVGLNIDFAGSHAMIGELLEQVDLKVQLVEADARWMSFPDGTFSSVSCFLGLQDIEIGFGGNGVRNALTEAVRVLQWEGILILLDEFSFERFDDLLAGLPLVVLDKAECELDVQWDRRVAERAVELFAEGWAIQARPANAAERRRLYSKAYARMKADMEKQLKNKGFYVPFGPVRFIISRKGIS
jgi:ubiquinone/menaquinone biosynthesis C-methylase UbiE